MRFAQEVDLENDPLVTYIKINGKPMFYANPSIKKAQIGYRGLMRGKRVVVAGIGNRIIVCLFRLLPNSLLMAMVDQRTQKRHSA